MGEILDEVTLADAVIRRAVALERRPVNLARIGHVSIETMASPDAPITLDIPENIVAFGDGEMIGTMLRIVLSNAVVHTPVGTRIWLRTAQTGDGVVIIVDDNGPGVASASRETIFEPFTRGSEDHHDPGLGLGLATVAQIAALHGGRAWVEDRHGGGASFRVLLPYEASTRPVTVDRSWQGIEHVDGGIPSRATDRRSHGPVSRRWRHQTKIVCAPWEISMKSLALMMPSTRSYRSSSVTCIMSADIRHAHR